VHAFTGRDGNRCGLPPSFRALSAFERHFPGKGGLTMERNLALEVVRVTEAAALASARLMVAGTTSRRTRRRSPRMRKALNFVQFKGRVVIARGSGTKPRCSTSGRRSVRRTHEGRHRRRSSRGTNIVSAGGYNAIAVIAIAEEGGFLHAPDTYMQKIAVGPKARGVIDITASPTENLRRIAKAQKAYVEDLCVIILDRPRHQDLIKEVREAGRGSS